MKPAPLGRNDTPIPLAENERARMLIGRLREGPASTLELQKSLPLVHVARQVWELRHWYGLNVTTGRLANNIAVYTLHEGPSVSTVPICKCGQTLRNVVPTLAAEFVAGKCPTHGKQVVRRV